VPFTSVAFVFYFLPAFLLAYLMAGRTYARNIVLLAASICFYTWGEARYVYVLLLSVVVNYVWGRSIAARQGRARSLFLWSGIGLNVAGLVVFKYTAFLFRAGGALFGAADFPAVTPEIHLPVGISFFTFKAISYLVDVHRKDVPAERNLLIFSTYLTMFPQILAGPIARFTDSAKGDAEPHHDALRIPHRSRVFHHRHGAKVTDRELGRRAGERGFFVSRGVPHRPVRLVWRSLLHDPNLF
jgi:alginate O-acetyltransferase complex protein AlgI